MGWLVLALAVLALTALALAAWACRRVEQLSRVLGDVDVIVGAVSERVGVTHDDIDAYHDRIHPDCVPAPKLRPLWGGR